MNSTIAVAVLLATTGVLSVAQPARAELPGAHPFYMHALADLRRAHHDIAVRGLDADTKHPHDKRCLRQVELAINDVKQAGVDDGKPMQEAIPGDPADHAGRLHRAEQDLNNALKDALKEESNHSKAGGKRSAIGLQHRASIHIKIAINEVGLALQAVSTEKK